MRVLQDVDQTMLCPFLIMAYGFFIAKVLFDHRVRRCRPGSQRCNIERRTTTSLGFWRDELLFEGLCCFDKVINSLVVLHSLTEEGFTKCGHNMASLKEQLLKLADCKQIARQRQQRHYNLD